jgi:hypothetical protein
MEEEQITFTLIWAERVVEVRCQPNWLNSDYGHIELRSTTRLPVTETGYRSHFVPGAAFSDEAYVRAYVERWLNEAAQTRAWQHYLKDSRQLTLF